MTWTTTPKWWQRGPWLPDDFYPWQASVYPWLIENTDTDWTPRTPVS